MADIKITKATIVKAIKELVAEDDIITVEGVPVSGAEILSYCDTALKQLESKAEKAKERAAKNKTKGDELRAEVFSRITEEFQTADAILEMIEGFEDVTKPKVIARLTQLVKAGEVEKEQIKVDNRKQMAYRLVSAVSEA